MQVTVFETLQEMPYSYLADFDIDTLVKWLTEDKRWLNKIDTFGGNSPLFTNTAPKVWHLFNMLETKDDKVMLDLTEYFLNHGHNDAYEFVLSKLGHENSQYKHLVYGKR